MEDDALQIRSDGVSWREVNGEIIALDLVSSSYFSTNKSGSVMWLALVEGADRERLVSILRSTYGLTEAVAVNDVDDFISLLRQHGLLNAAS